MENAYLLIGVSVLIHVTWNLLARHVDAKANYLWWGLLAHLVLLGPYALWQLIEHAEWMPPLFYALAITAAANTLYFISLRRAYHYAPVALVYPLARSSPILIALWSWLVFSEDFSSQEILSICVSVFGLWILASSCKQGDTQHALPWTLAAAFSTSIYSMSDKVAVEYLQGFGEQLGFITVGYTTSFIGLSVIQRSETGSWIPPARPPWTYILMGGLFIGTAYALVVKAMRERPAAHVVSYTNAGIVLAVLLSIAVFRERAHWQRRFIGALVVTGGLILLGWSQ